MEPVNRHLFDAVPLWREEVVFQCYAGNELYDKGEVTLEDLARQVYVNPGLRQKYSQTFPEYCRQLGFEPRILDTGGCCEHATLLEIAIREGALFAAPESMVDLSKTHIRNRRLADPLYWEVSLVTQKGAMPSPGLAAFLGYMAGRSRG